MVGCGEPMRRHLILILCTALLLSPTLLSLVDLEVYETEPSMLISSFSQGPDTESGSDSGSAVESSGNENELPPILSNVSQWRIGDTWRYDAVLDASTVVEDAPELDGASVGLISGPAEMKINGIELYNDSGNLVPVYLVVIQATVSGPGTFPEPTTGILASGTLHIEFIELRYQRVSDLAFLGVERDIDLDFQFTFIRIDVSDFHDSRTFSPAREILDFPIREGDVWTQAYTETSSLSGYGGPFEIPSEPEVKQRDMLSSVNDPKTPPVSHADCSEVGEVEVEEAGDLVEQHWWCEGIAGDVYWWTDEVGVEGISGSFRLTSYEPVAIDSGTISIVLELLPNSTGLQKNVTAQIHVEDVAGANITIENLTFYGVVANSSEQFLIDHRDGVEINFTAGSDMDDTPTEIDWATHGLVVCHGSDGTFDTCSSVTLRLQGSAVGELIRRRTIIDLVDIIEPLFSSGEDATWLIHI
jgi:hypothetical protein